MPARNGMSGSWGRGARPLPRALLVGLVSVTAGAGIAASGAAAAVTPVTQRPIGGAPTAKRAWMARVLLPTVGRAAPSTSARVTRRISPEAPYDRSPQVLLVLRTATGPGGPWYRVLLPVRPNGTAAWVRGRDLLVRATAYRIRVTLDTRTLEVLRAGRVVSRDTVAVGTTANPTPTGLFGLSEVVPQTPANGFFGPYILTLTAHSERLSDFDGGKGQVALHGTSLPGLLGQAVSHGCVRLSNAAVTRIAKLVPPGAPVEVRPTAVTSDLPPTTTAPGVG